MKVNAASTENIIKSMQVSSTNPQYVKIDRADNPYYEPIIYFSVEGEVKEYIEPINPVRMDDRVKIQPISANVSLPEFLRLAERKSPVRGQIRVKHLNGFIDKGMDIEFTSQYLIDRFLEDIRRDRASTLSMSRTDGTYLAELIMYIAGKGAWNRVSADNMYERIAAGSPYDAVMSKEQWMIMDTVAPGLGYCYFRMRNDLLNLSGQINIKNQDIARKDQEIGMLKDRIRHLEESLMQVKTLK